MRNVTAERENTAGSGPVVTVQMENKKVHVNLQNYTRLRSDRNRQ
jgi:hypothetical protein